MFIVLEGRRGVQPHRRRAARRDQSGFGYGRDGADRYRPRPATIALDMVHVAAIYLAHLRELMATDGNLGILALRNLTRILSDQLRHADTRLDALTSVAIKA